MRNLPGGSMAWIWCIISLQEMESRYCNKINRQCQWIRAEKWFKSTYLDMTVFCFFLAASYSRTRLWAMRRSCSLPGCSWFLPPRPRRTSLSFSWVMGMICWLIWSMMVKLWDLTIEVQGSREVELEGSPSCNRGFMNPLALNFCLAIDSNDMHISWVLFPKWVRSILFSSR